MTLKKPQDSFENIKIKRNRYKLVYFCEKYFRLKSILCNGFIFDKLM